MKITILTLFPSMFDGFINSSIIKRAIEKEKVTIEVIDFRNYSNDKNKKVDFPPVGGGSGMIIALQPIVDCLKKIKTKDSKVYLLSASGTVYNQQKAKELSLNKHIILICGHYEGIDERIKYYIDGQICVGDYILTGGEIPAMLVADSIIRLIDGVISQDSLKEESFENNLLEYPQYTLPRDFEGHKIPDILFSGNHKAIAKYRMKESILKTKENRNDLYDESKLTDQQKESLIDDFDEKQAIDKAKKFMK